MLDLDILSWRASFPEESELLIAELYEFRKFLEPLAASLAASHATHRDIDTITEAYKDMGAAGDDGAKVLGPDVRRAPGTLPIRGSLATMSSQARSAVTSKSGASAGRTCQPVTLFPSTRMDRMFGNSRRRLSWCSAVVASQTPLSAVPLRLSRRITTILSST